jgi:ABC-2 type transport system permease protein
MKLLISLRLELAKVFRQRGTYVGHAIIALVLGLMVWGLWRYGPEQHLRRRFSEEMVIGGNMVTGLTPARQVMEPALFILVPMLVAAIAGGLVAGEARSGVLRTWMCRPVSRLTLITAKQLAAWLHAISLTLFLGLFALLLGHIFFGPGDLVDFLSGDGMVIFDERLGLIRLGMAYGLAALTMCGIASLAMLFSVVFENPMVAAASAVAFLPVTTIIASIEYFEFLEPYLLTTYLDIWRPVFRATLSWNDFVPGVYCTVGYCLIPYVIGAIIFWRKDITS